jgi:hypothetical protein
MTQTRENLKTLREICPSATLSTNPTWIDPVLRGKRQATSRLSHGSAIILIIQQHQRHHSP